MKVIEDIERFKNNGLALTIGFFDGVHLGHRHLINQIKETADRERLQVGVLTFWPHPRIVLNEDYKPMLLNSIEEKFDLLNELPIDYCIKVPFTKEFANYFASDFMEKILKDKLNVKHLIVGYDHRFGKNREEGYDDYLRHGEAIGMNVSQASPYYEDGFCISSSFVRSLIMSGDVKLANKYLGYNYKLKGKVIEGHKVGRTLGFPTANIEINTPSKCIPKVGAYAVIATLQGKKHRGMMYIGSRPTLNSELKLSVEVNIFDFEEEIYGEEITIDIMDFIRKQEKFESIELLKENIASDKEKSLRILKSFDLN